MKVKRFTAANMQTALRQVTLQLGADAVIISTKNVAEGIEVVAAIDYQPQNAAAEVDRQLRLQKELELSRQHLLESADKPKNSAVKQPLQVDVSTHEGMVAALNKLRKPGSQPVAHASRQLERSPFQPSLAANLSAKDSYEARAQQSLSNSHVGNDAQQQVLQQVQGELAALKEFMVKHIKAAENTTATPAVTSNVNKTKSINTQLRQLCQQQGIATAWTNQLLTKVSANDLNQARKQLQQAMVEDLPVSLVRMFERGGMFALVGPTGAGKTTTIGKIAAQFVMRHGAGSVALVTLDTYRVAAHDQLRSFARILGVDLHIVPQQGDLNAMLDKLSHKKLILVDSAGLVKKDPHFTTQLAMLRRTDNRLKKLLVMPLTNHSQGLQENYRTLKLVGLSGCILTKLDECFSLGAALSIAALARLPITLVADGPHIPDDIQYPNAAKLVQQAEQMARMAQTRQQAKQDMRARTLLNKEY